MCIKIMKNRSLHEESVSYIFFSYPLVTAQETIQKLRLYMFLYRSEFVGAH
jgi:hypothetical protein